MAAYSHSLYCACADRATCSIPESHAFPSQARRLERIELDDTRRELAKVREQLEMAKRGAQEATVVVDDAALQATIAERDAAVDARAAAVAEKDQVGMIHTNMILYGMK